MSTAPLFGEHSVINFAKCEFLKVDPMTNIRVASWTGGTRGTIHIFNGRTEYIEKYFDVIEGFLTRGFNVTAHDWRGQGLSTRNETHPTRCHIVSFEEHQSDARSVMEHFSDLPGPHYLFCHSMGGAIGTRYLLENNIIKAAIFSAPMWGIHLSPLLEKLRPTLMKVVKRLNLQWRTAIGTKDKNYELHTKFENNLLTSNEDQWNKLVSDMKQFPELNCGGPTYYWLAAAYKEMNWLKRQKGPSIPMLLFLGTQEEVVDPKMIKQKANKNKNISLVELENGKHESYLEQPELVKKMWLNIDMFMDQYS